MVLLATLMVALFYAPLPQAGAAAPGSAAALLDQVSSQVQPTATPEPPQTPAVNESIGSETCLSCHSNPNLNMPLENGDLLSLYISSDVYHASVHGKDGYACVQCHTTVGNYPHPPFSAKDRRDATLQLYPLCQRCHPSQYELTQDSVHQAALDSGNRQAAVCVDCHTAHATRSLTDPQTGELLPHSRRWVPQTCANCHYAIYQEYSTSVHGSALLGEGNPDVPTCIDCHGVHNIKSPTTAAFRLSSPELCAKCHTNPAIMDKYGLSTQVLNTYVADFHGTTITIFQKEYPNQENNKAVCYDCHGIHNIKRVNDPVGGLAIKQNLLARCQVCHPDANSNFPTAWLSHYIPSPERHPLVFSVNLFYSIFIPTILGGMAVLVVLDAGAIFRKKINAHKKPKHVAVFPANEESPASAETTAPQAATLETPKWVGFEKSSDVETPEKPAAPAQNQNKKTGPASEQEPKNG
jgi:hypothetical protein